MATAQGKLELAEKHLERVQGAWDPPDWPQLSMFGFYALEAAVEAAALHYGLEVQKKLTAMQARIPVIFITGHGDVPMAVTALQNGAVDFIQKPYREQDLLDAINKAMAQSESANVDDFDQHLAGLTSRELEVYEKLLHGSSSKQIAMDLGVSPRTVDAHRHNLLQKLGFGSVKDLIVHRAARNQQR